MSSGYTLQPRRPTHVGAQVGTGVHAAAGHALAEKIRTGGESMGTDADCEEIGIERMRERITDDGCDWDRATPDLNTAEKQIRRMSRVWRRGPAAAEMPLQSEERLEATIRPGLILSGQADALMVGTPDSVLRDTKTGAMRRANGPQYGAYALIFQAHGYQLGTLIEDYLARVSIKKEQPEVEAHVIDIKAARVDAWDIVQEIAAAVDEFRKRTADPRGQEPIAAFGPNPASVLCGAKWCPAHGTDACRAHA